MPNITPVQANFSVGEVSPELIKRSTLENQRAGVQTLTNFYPDSRGPAVRRKGFRYLGTVGVAGPQLPCGVLEEVARYSTPVDEYEFHPFYSETTGKLYSAVNPQTERTGQLLVEFDPVLGTSTVRTFSLQPDGNDADRPFRNGILYGDPGTVGQGNRWLTFTTSVFAFTQIYMYRANISAGFTEIGYNGASQYDNSNGSWSCVETQDYIYGNGSSGTGSTRSVFAIAKSNGAASSVLLFYPARNPGPIAYIDGTGADDEIVIPGFTGTNTVLFYRHPATGGFSYSQPQADTLPTYDFGSDFFFEGCGVDVGDKIFWPVSRDLGTGDGGEAFFLLTDYDGVDTTTVTPNASNTFVEALPTISGVEHNWTVSSGNQCLAFDEENRRIYYSWEDRLYWINVDTLIIEYCDGLIYEGTNVPDQCIPMKVGDKVYFAHRNATDELILTRTEVLT